MNIYIDTQKINNLGWKAKVSLIDGLTKTINDYEKNIKNYL